MFKNLLHISKLKKIKCVILDVDGVLTDGRIYYDNNGIEQKCFHARDGSGIKMAMHVGIIIVIVTGRQSNVVKYRAQDLGIKYVYQKALKKHLFLEEIKKKIKVSEEEIAFIADDIIDLELFKQIGYKVAVNDAVNEIKKIADYITKHKGGKGAVREFLEVLIKVKKLWPKAIERYL